MIGSGIFSTDLVAGAKRETSKIVQYQASQPQVGNAESLGARYAELLRLREAVSRTQSDLKLSTNAERAVTKEGRTFPYH